MLANIKKSGIKRLTLLEGPSNKKYTEWLRLLRIAREVRPEKEGKDEDSPRKRPREELYDICQESEGRDCERIDHSTTPHMEGGEKIFPGGGNFGAK